MIKLDNTNLDIEAIYKINNPNLRDAYNLEKERLKVLNIDLREKLLFHGTSSNNPRFIYTNGFKVELSRFGTLGEGLYFARQFNYSFSYAYIRHGFAYLLVAKVITGRSKCIQYRKDIDCFKDCESLTNVDNPNDTYMPQMFVVNGNNKAYPMYLVVVNLIYSFGLEYPKNTYLKGGKSNRLSKTEEDFDPLL
jgi:hypothetical protein